MSVADAISPLPIHTLSPCSVAGGPGMTLGSDSALRVRVTKEGQQHGTTDHATYLRFVPIRLHSPRSGSNTDLLARRSARAPEILHCLSQHAQPQGSRGIWRPRSRLLRRPNEERQEACCPTRQERRQRVG